MNGLTEQRIDTVGDVFLEFGGVLFFEDRDTGRLEQLCNAESVPRRPGPTLEAPDCGDDRVGQVEPVGEFH